MRLFKTPMFIVLVLSATSVSAGEVTMYNGYGVGEAIFDQTNGILSAARKSNNAKEYVGCQVDAYSDGTFSVQCFGMDHTGNTDLGGGTPNPLAGKVASCTAKNDQNSLRVASMVNDTSNVEAFWRNATDTTCGQLQVTNGSEF
jgi:hypothetical protein